MPQPLRIWDRDIRFGRDSADQRPTLAVRIVRVTTAWTQLESLLGTTLASILYTDAQIGVTMYLALTGTAAQEAALTAAVKLRLPKVLQNEFIGLLPIIRKRSAERNRIVHCMWGVSPNLPDALINSPGDNLARSLSRVMPMMVRFPDLPPPTEPEPEFIAACSIYKQSDFEDIERRIDECGKALTAFKNKVELEWTKRQMLARALGAGLITSS